MGSLCCCRQKEEKKSVSKNNVQKNGSQKSGYETDMRTPPTVKTSTAYKSDDSPPTDKKLISDERLKEESKTSFKGGESGYVKQKKKIQKLKTKSLDGSQYNTKGLVDERSQEFRIVKAFLDRKGYDLITSIGSGNYAEVYKAVKKKNPKLVAVKVIDLMKANENYRSNFLQSEIDVLQVCKHTNIIKMYEICQTNKRVFMIMEFAPNGTLTDWLKERGAFAESTAHLMFTQILSAIHHMHSRRIAHRDLKLENILLTQNFNPKISDFSYALKFGPNDPKSTSFCGSLPYFSPELLMRQPYNPLISDIWSLGVCFYIMLNDGLPFKLGDDKLMLKKQLTKDWKFKTKVDVKLTEGLKSMIRKMLEPNVDLRITAEQLMNEDWIKNY